MNNHQPTQASLEQIHPRSLKHLSEKLQALIKSKLWLQIIIGMILGITVGVVLGPTLAWVDQETAKIIGEWVALPGYLFLAVIQMIVVPLVFASVVRGIASNENIDQLKSTGLRLLIYFLMTTTVAVTLGISVGLVVKPGSRLDISGMTELQPDQQPELPSEEEISTDFTLQDIPENIVNILPNNPLSSMTNSEMLQIVIFAIAFGLALVSMKATAAKPMLEFLGSLEEVCMTIVRWVMIIAPLAVMGLIAKVTLSTGLDILQSLGFYVITVLGGFVLLLVFYMLLALLLGGRQPLRFLGHIREAMLMAFSTNSSAATMPLSIKVAEQNLKVRPSTARFIIPIGATVNMDASAMYQGLATIFIAQLYGIDLALPALVALVLTAVGASIGTPATPGVGIIILSTVLVSAGIPLEGLTLIIGIDRILELFRASLNVTGDLVASTVMDRMVTLPEPKEKEILREEKIQQIREFTGEDTVVQQVSSS